MCDIDMLEDDSVYTDQLLFSVKLMTYTSETTQKGQGRATDQACHVGTRS